MPKIVDRVEYKKELLESCFDLFSRKGFNNVTMREIAAAIGVSTGTLYHYFPTKDNILENMFNYIKEKNVGDYLEIINDEDPIEKRVQVIIDFWYTNQDYYQNVMLLAIDLYRNKREKIEDLFKNFFDFYISAVSEKLNISENLSHAIVAQLLGLLFHSILTSEKMSYAYQLDLLKDIFTSVLQTNEDRSKDSQQKVKEILFNIISNNIKK